MLDMMLQRDPGERPTAAQLLASQALDSIKLDQRKPVLKIPENVQERLVIHKMARKKLEIDAYQVEEEYLAFEYQSLSSQGKQLARIKTTDFASERIAKQCMASVEAFAAPAGQGGSDQQSENAVRILS